MRAKTQGQRELAYRKASAIMLREVLIEMAEDGLVDADLWWDTRHKVEADLAAIRAIEGELQAHYETANAKGRK